MDSYERCTEYFNVLLFICFGSRRATHCMCSVWRPFIFIDKSVYIEDFRFVILNLWKLGSRNEDAENKEKPDSIRRRGEVQKKNYMNVLHVNKRSKWNWGNTVSSASFASSEIPPGLSSSITQLLHAKRRTPQLPVGLSIKWWADQ